MSEWTERAAYFKKVHRCVRCGKQDAYTLSGKQRCYECTEYGKIKSKENHCKHKDVHNKKMKERKEKLKSEGICVQCGKRKAVLGLKCEKCRTKFNNYQRQRLQQGGYNDNTGTC